MELHKLSVSLRENDSTKGATKQLRREGSIPAIVYGEGKDPVSVQINAREFEHLVHGRAGEHAIVQLDFADNQDHNSPAIVKSVQHHPIKSNVLHVDFLRIRLDKKIQVVVPIELKGQPIGVVEGGILDHQLREIEIECLALEAPEYLTLDVSGIALGESIHVTAIEAPSGVEILTDSERTVAAVHVPRGLKEAEEGEEGEEGAEGEEAAGSAEGEEAAE